MIICNIYGKCLNGNFNQSFLDEENYGVVFIKKFCENSLVQLRGFVDLFND